jgi:hypothetical protein
LALIVHALAFGVAAARAIFAPVMLRLALATGVILFSVGPLTALAWAPRIQEAAVFLVTSSCLALAMLTLFGRVPTLRDEPW